MAELLRSPILAGIPHGFSTCVEAGQWPVLDGRALARVKQIHSADVAVVTGSEWTDASREADALVTAASNMSLGIITADCAPVLLADKAAGVIGAAHAGWRGAVTGIIDNTLAAMCDLGATRNAIVAAIGPTIAQSSYEVDAAFRARFEPHDDRYFATGRPDHWQFDLPACVRSKLQHAGVAAVDDLELDTYTGSVRFHSFRRATHDGANTQGRQLSLIALPK